MDVLLNSAEVNHVNAATGSIFSGQSAPVRSGSLATRSVGWRESARCLKVFVTVAKLLPHGGCYRNQVIASQWVLPRSRRQPDGRRDQRSNEDRSTQGYSQPVRVGDRR